MRSEEAELRAFYEEEARQRTRTPPAGFRVDVRTAFIDTLSERGCSSVIDLGAGPAGDGRAFVDACIDHVGLDLAVANAHLAAESGLTVVPGSLAAPPFRARSFDAGWSMSALMHLTEDETPPVLASCASLLRPGAPLLVGLWGGTLGDITTEGSSTTHHRRFRLRSLDRNRELLAAIGTIELAERHDAGPDGWEYHVLRLRVG